MRGTLLDNFDMEAIPPQTLNAGATATATGGMFSLDDATDLMVSLLVGANAGSLDLALIFSDDAAGTTTYTPGGCSISSVVAANEIDVLQVDVAAAAAEFKTGSANHSYPKYCYVTLTESNMGDVVCCAVITAQRKHRG